ncbi:Cro/CI family transcriptional regulator [Pseudomonas sp. DWP3-1-2]|uniref:Cro/CI family transcriptional regulator n=1 Tax=Pseudomonas sp. DWP3-1-2 TaxID=2804645 RepID=UPI003CEFEE6C
MPPALFRKNRRSGDAPVHKIPLAEYAAKRHALTAEKLGMSQGSLSKAIRENRVIFVIESGDGITALEEKPFPSQRRGGLSQPCQDTNPAILEASGLDVPVNPSTTSLSSAARKQT